VSVDLSISRNVTISSRISCLYDSIFQAKEEGVSEVVEQDLHEMLRKNPAMRIVDIREDSEVAHMPIPVFITLSLLSKCDGRLLSQLISRRACVKSR
jgi:hypothetical protein